jgi:hypothetical protein
MHESLENLASIKNEVNEIINKTQLKTKPKIIVVSKTFPLDKILPLIKNGHDHFGENKIQEAEEKWVAIKKNNKNLQLHMIGKLQNNKAKKAVKLFDYIHSLDSEKLALKISEYEVKLKKKTKLFIQVKLAEESTKSGIGLGQLNDFYNYCTKKLSLNIIGLMCLPPINSDSDKYFKKLKECASDLKLNELSMGMSADFRKALENGSTYLRLGTLILGERKIT